ncbi:MULTISPECIES: Y-family DNA polymerase [unclassified Pseudodesulfovibrio]|uniref:Y-family DNA polymerase n=1 Tax=unclassified Pseudodesulfovibrio TaxID=2661612 RepID=UPI000FEC103F|nr:MULTISPECIES: Y-family DNA polymerase [unclassified Pseudodesulfovibrio]MCJ2165526.1 Y-family DNA polymerase [Pseudodesulfovibrio sp. S3-i]RWU03112.1 Y-family DNA polymerase [Pseudodesulfovibrio sp. S3]
MPNSYALMDCNNFYASCERAFRPELVGRPVVVLSNNDGCVIARSDEAKGVGVPMGAPYFKCRSMLERHGVAVFSSNYALYGDMSARVMRVLSRFCPGVEVYSIDEAFCDLTGVPGGAEAFGRRLRATVQAWTGIPVSVGIGPTKTLAKLANRFAKKQARCRGVFDFGTSPAPDRVLEWTGIGDIWGIGPRHAKRLRKMGVDNALKFRGLKRDWVQKKMTVAGLHTLLELRGLPCLGLTDGPASKKTIVSSRSFGHPVTRLEDILEATAKYTTRAAEKLRRQRSVTSNLLISLETNTFKLGQPQYSNALSVPLAVATAHTPTLIRAATSGMERIFRDGYQYKKCGIMLSGLEPERGRWLNLLALPPAHRPDDRPLMQAVDSLNSRWGRDTVSFAASGVKQGWKMKREMRSPRYTTVWKEILTVTAG